MSISKVFSPLFSVNQTKNLIAQKAGVNVQERWTSVNSVSGNTINFSNLDPPNAETLVSRLMLLRTRIRVKSDRKIDVPHKLGFRNFPINSVIQNVGLTVNGLTFTEQVQDHIHATSRYFLDDDDTDISHAGRIVDRFQTYDDAADSSLDPLGYSYDSNENEKRRYRLVQLVSNTVAAGFEAIYEVVEPLMMSMLRFNKFHLLDHNAFYNITTMSLNFNFDTKSKMLVSSDWDNGTGTLALPVLTAQFVDSFDVCQYFMTPDEEAKRTLLPSFDQPAVYHYLKHYLEIKPVSGTYTAIARSPSTATIKPAVNNIQSDNFVLSVVPQRVFIYVEVDPSSRTSIDCNAFQGIDRVRITFANDTNVLATFQESNLWSMSSENGYKYGLLDWQYDYEIEAADDTITTIPRQGAVICVDFSKDMQLPSGLAPGVLGNFNMRVEVDTYNLRPLFSGESAKTFRLCVLRQENSMIEIMGGKCSENKALLSVDDVINAKVLDKESLQTYTQMKELYGSAFFDQPAEMAMKLLKMIGKKGVKAVSDMMEEKDGGLIVGGRKLTRADLMRLSKST
jgi:hypothetical protein